MTIGLYKITNTVNGKYYIGSSKEIEKRWLCHKGKLNNNTHENVHLQASFNKHGVDAFVYEIIKELQTIQLKKHYLHKNKSCLILLLRKNGILRCTTSAR